MRTRGLVLCVLTAAALAGPARAQEDATKAEAVPAPPGATAEAAAPAEELAPREKPELALQRAQQQALEARGMDARMRALAGVLAVAIRRLPGDMRAQRFAVLPFEDVGDEAKQKSLGLVVSDLLVTDLARDHGVPLLERAAVAKILDELALQQSGAIEESQQLSIGKMAGARALVVGQVLDAGENFTVAVRVIDAESAAVLTAQSVQLPKGELVAFSANAVVLKSRSGAAFRSLVAPGWGQSYNGETTKAWVFGGVSYTLALGTVGVGALAGYTALVAYPSAGISGDSAKLPAADKAALVEQTRQAANAQLTVAGVLAGVTAVAWLVNVTDAYLSGTDIDSLDAAMAKN